MANTVFSSLIYQLHGELKELAKSNYKVTIPEASITTFLRSAANYTPGSSKNTPAMSILDIAEFPTTLLAFHHDS